MSTDSTTTLRGAITPDISLTDLPVSAPVPSSSKNPFPLHIPNLAQAQTVIKGMFRSQTPNNSRSLAVGSHESRSVSAVTPMSLARSSDAARSRTPVPALSESREPRAGSMFSDTSYSRTHSPILDPEADALNDVARANAEYNAAASKPRSSSSSRYYSSVRDSLHFANAASATIGNGSSGTTERLYPTLPLRSSPEHYHTQATTPHPDGGGSNQVRPTHHNLDSEDTFSNRLKQPGASQWPRDEGRTGPATRPLPEQQATKAPTAQSMPWPHTDGTNNRYVPASRTMMSNGPRGSVENTSSEPADNRSRHMQDGHTVATPLEFHRQRRTSVSRVSPTLSIPRVSAPKGGASSDTPSLPRDDAQRNTADQGASDLSPERLSGGHEDLKLPRQLPRPPSPHSATAQASNPISRNSAANTTRPASKMFLRNQVGSPEDVQNYSSATQQSLPQTRGQFPRPASRDNDAASKYVSYAATRGTNAPPDRIRRDSTSNLTHATTRPLPTPSPAQGNHPGWGMAPPRVQSSIYEPSSAGRNLMDPYSQGQNERVSQALGSLQQQSAFVSTNAGNSIQTPYRGDEHFDIIAPPPFVPPSTASSDPGPEQHRRDSFVEQSNWSYARDDGRRCMLPPPSSGGSEHVTHRSARTPEHSHTPFPAPRSEPQRRYSDGDSSVAGDSTYAPAYATETPCAASAELQPQRRYSDGDQVPSNSRDHTSLTLFRTVRWNENLICPSPIFSHQRRKGWFNRKGDQLWTNDGAYKPPPAGHEYPPDLESYPEHGDGWMNEHGVRIDMGHRLIPKAPLKSALKPNRT
ncbi:hypothetical protein H0H87_011805 [Tephrocybe sp. NHM501043]|nr:hypothetical protein H0H87_011805 [Tephrocybe sp. NHM501043]